MSDEAGNEGLKIHRSKSDSEIKNDAKGKSLGAKPAPEEGEHQIDTSSRK
jgi:hypothetical protein